MKTVSKLLRAAVLLLASRKDEALKKYPDLAKQIKYFIEQDPSYNQKYLDWSCQVLLAGQALEREISDVVKLFDKYSKNLLKKDIKQYKVTEFTDLRDNLFEISKKRLKTKEDYKMPADCQSEVIYDSENFLVRHIINKSASIHFGLGTKWCITMKDQSYFEDDESNNVVFFFIFNKHLTSDDPDYKLAVSVQRDQNNKITKTEYWNSKDHKLKSDVIYNKLGQEDIAIEAEIQQVALKAPKSILARLANGESTEQEMSQVYDAYKVKPEEEREKVFALLAKHLKNSSILEKIFKSDQCKHYVADNPYCSEKLLREIALDFTLRVNVAANPSCPEDLIIDLFEESKNLGNSLANTPIVLKLLGNTSCPPGILRSFSLTLSSNIIRISSILKRLFILAIVKNPNCPEDVLRDWMKEEDFAIREAIVRNPNSTADIREYIRYN